MKEVKIKKAKNICAAGSSWLIGKGDVTLGELAADVFAEDKQAFRKWFLMKYFTIGEIKTQSTSAANFLINILHLGIGLDTDSREDVEVMSINEFAKNSVLSHYDVIGADNIKECTEKYLISSQYAYQAISAGQKTGLTNFLLSELSKIIKTD